jgi:osomolarity two-component system sensor histidine kinase CHK1
MSASAMLPHEIVSELPGYHDVSLLYAVGYLQAFRAVRDDDGKDVFLKLCPTAHLETLARLRHNWTLQGEIAIQGASNPQKLLPFGDGGLSIEYGRWGERTSREIFLSPEPYISSGSGIDALPAELSLGDEPIFRSRADILALLKVFVTVSYLAFVAETRSAI